MKTDDCGRFTIIGFEPFLILNSKNGDTFETLRKYLDIYKSDRCKFPQFGGCIGYFAYDLVNEIEVLPNMNPDDINTDDMIICFYENGIVIDGDNVSFANEHSKNEFEKSKGFRISPKSYFDKAPEIKSNFTRQEYIEMVEKARNYIYEGDIFQVNLSQRFQTNIQEEPIETFLRLRKTSAAPFSAFLNFGNVQVISNSPERFMKIENARIETKPIKGTFPRGSNEAEDAMNMQLLSESAKDKAELTMIVDLERNDLGRVCKFGSVTVEKHIEIEAYANVFHGVSTVSGELREDVNFIDCLLATFPGGSITGAPKVRAMEIIEELEPVKRGIYTGAIGYIGFDGYVDLNVAIRTIVIKDGVANFNVGGGIVWDSNPESEYKETLDKGKMIMEVLTHANSFAKPDLFETVAIDLDGEIFLLDKHLERMAESAAFFGLEMPKDFVEKTLQYVKVNKITDKILKIILSDSEFVFSIRENPYNFERKQRGYSLCVSHLTKNENSILLQHKTTDISDNTEEFHKTNSLGFDDALFLNSRGFVTETTKCNIFYMKDGVLFTSNIDCGVLPGVIRNWVIDLTRGIGVEVIETSFTLDELLEADFVFVTNSAMMIIPVCKINVKDFTLKKHIFDRYLLEITMTKRI